MNIDIDKIQYAIMLYDIWVKQPLLDYIKNPSLKRKLQIKHKTIGIVCHDRILNDMDLPKCSLPQ